MNFGVIKAAVAKQFEQMQKHPLFRVNIDGDTLWQAYLASFPAGTNPVLRQRTEHDCGCCKQFIRAMGGVVTIIDGLIASIWDVSVPTEPGYQAVADAMSILVRSKPIADIFLHDGRTIGTDKNFEQLTGSVQTWTHFHVNLDAKHVAAKKAIPTKLGDVRTTRDVFARGLAEISDDAIETVLDLISQGSLYRGEEHKYAIEVFKLVRAEYAALPTDAAKSLYLWTKGLDANGAVARIKNTVIGTLLTDLSSGVEIDRAVAAFESKVAPANYKRPTSVVTKGMIEKAKTKLVELGLVSALERRYATLADITVNNVLWANKSTRRVINGDVFDELVASTSSRTKGAFDKVEEVSIEQFIGEIVPRAESIEVLFENQLANNLVSLVAPVDPTAGLLFKWPNRFSWSYAGDFADSIKERVKKAGGNVGGDLCCRLAWYNYDDLDLHLVGPGRDHIYFGNKRGICGGELDVDMNAGGGRTREAVENIFFHDRRKMAQGVYKLYVNQYSQREAIDVGFEVEIDFMGTVHRFAYDKVVKGDVTVAVFKYTHADGLEITESLPRSQAVKTIWGLPTQTFHQVSALMFSPNYWDERTVGNKHVFFMLENCRNDGVARGFYNEFLKSELDTHRKVFEIVGSKMKTETSQDQLSGLGFSSTQKNTLICRVKGSFSRTVKVQF